MRFQVIATLALVVASGPVLAQSLGEAAEREAQKKKQEKRGGSAAVPAYGAEDLKRAGQSDTSNVTVLGPAAQPAAAKPGQPAPKPAAGQAATTAKPAEPVGRPPENPEAWRALAAQRRKAVQDAEARVRELDTRIGGLRVDANPTANVTDPFRQQTLQADLQKAQAERDAAQAQLARARQALEEFEDQARRKGIPPGWIREP